MSPKGFQVYGERFIKTFLDNWDIDLWVYMEGLVGVRDRLPDGPKYRDMDELDNIQWGGEQSKFLDLYDTPKANGIVSRNGKPTKVYTFDAIKFSRKVFAITDPWGPYGWRIWLDADVETFSKVDRNTLRKFCPQERAISYIGRDHRDWHHSECGFVGYNMNLPETRAFLERFRWYYTSGMVFSLLEWHDSYVFDKVMAEFYHHTPLFHNLAQGIRGMHPWPDTVLGKYMTHSKGPLEKMRVYGQTI